MKRVSEEYNHSAESLETLSGPHFLALRGARGLKCQRTYQEGRDDSGGLRLGGEAVG